MSDISGGFLVMAAIAVVAIIAFIVTELMDL